MAQLKSKPAILITAAITAIVAVAGTLLVVNLGGNSAEADASASASGDGLGKDQHVVVLAGPSNDPFVSAYKHGVDDATSYIETQGGEVTYLDLKSWDDIGPELSQLQEVAGAQNPTAVTVAPWVPDAQLPGIQKLIDDGVEVVAYNSGAAEAEELGITYVGSEEYEAGFRAGEAYAEDGAENVVFVNPSPGSVNTEQRGAGVIAGAESKGAKGSQLSLPDTANSNPTEVSQAVSSALLADETIDAIHTNGSAQADAAEIGIAQAGREVRLGTFDVSNAVAQKIQDGQFFLAIDQQPYLQGFYSTIAAYQKAALGLSLINENLATGPLLITKDSDLEQLFRGIEFGIR